MEYYDDNYYGYENTDNNDIHSVSSCSSDASDNNSEYKKKKSLIEDMKKMDRDYNVIKRRVDGEKRLQKIEFYGTNTTPGTRIRDPITGYRQKYIVGSLDEDLFFKVRLSTGECGQTPPTVFYDSPEQYEAHMFCVLSRDIKVNWHEKYNSTLRFLSKESERRERENIGMTIVK